MKRLLILFTLLINEILVYGQSVPPGIPYQAVVRNLDGSVAANVNLTARFTLHQNTTDGAVEFQETHALVSNAQGLVSAVIGQGTAVQSNFSSIVWSNITKFLQVEMDLGSGYVDLGTQQLMSVPFAMYAASGTPGPQGPAGLNGDENAWGLLGNNIASDTNKFIGTLSNHDFVFYTNNTERMRLSSSGALGIGGSPGTYKLNVYNGPINLTDGTSNFSFSLDDGSILNQGIFNKNTYGGGIIQAPIFGNIGMRLRPNHWDDGVFILSDKNLDGSTDFSALSVLANGWVGIGKNKPSHLFQVSDESSGIDSSLFFGNSGKLGVGCFDNSSTVSLLCQTSGSFLSVYDLGSFKRADLDIEGDTSVQFTNFQFNIFSKTSTEQAQFRFFRRTNTTGQKNVVFFRGNNTTQVSAIIGVDGGNSYFNNHGGNLGIGTSSPARTLHVNAVMRLEPISSPPASPSKGDMYFDSVLNKLRVFDGSVWQNCW